VHEYSIARALVERVEAEAAGRRATAVRSVLIRIGELAGVDADLLATAYRTIADGGACGRSALEIATVAAQWTCRACGRAIDAGGPLRCGACGAPAVLAQGDEILLERIVMDVEDEGGPATHVRDARI
jgi:hydrogenase nickel incorporation protein HypA/HybF